MQLTENKAHALERCLIAVDTQQALLTADC
jgi:hypothetical protein